ncbi:zinc finger protein 267-like [Topomyia yanbarensis]|uniref:zinc finger protein 267-like n=1 Tax=Topomyia yanbarensis TaxID=2498891 RepID=UPI00273BC30C|nr:zinc finger protein 267-like [Topomyia yanbarensis]
MPKSCAIPGCHSKHDSTGKTLLVGVTCTPILAQWWRDAPWNVFGSSSSLQDTHICVTHFREDQLKRNGEALLVKANSVPSINLPTNKIELGLPESKQGPLPADGCDPLQVHCRFCGVKQKYPIQNHLGDLMESEELLQLCLGSGRFLEGLPTGVCNKCLHIVKSTTNFIKDCKLAQHKLQKMFSESSQQTVGLFIKGENEIEIDHCFEMSDSVSSNELDDSHIDNETTPFLEVEDEIQNNLVNYDLPDPLVLDRRVLSEPCPTEGLYKCSTCQRSFNRKRALDAHKESIHEGRVFSCKICGKTMGWRKTLQRHMKSHEENYYKHKCIICLKLFSRPSHLRLHMTTHSGEKVRCPLCSSGFRCNYNLGEHLKKIHKMDSISSKIMVQQVKSQSCGSTSQVV